LYERVDLPGFQPAAAVTGSVPHSD